MRAWAARGKFIVFEGLNGSGCSTHSRLLAEFLRQRGHTVVLTAEPNPLGTNYIKIEEVLMGRKNTTPKYLQKLFIEDRKEHLKKIVIPALAQGITVISDRYFFSTLAFGSIDIEPEWLMSANKKFFVPDISIIMSVPPEICIARIQKSGDTKEIFDKLAKLKKAWETYESLPKIFPNVFVVDGTPPKSDVHHIITRIVMSKLL